MKFLNYYRRNICNLAAVFQSLTALTRNDKATGLIVPFCLRSVSPLGQDETTPDFYSNIVCPLDLTKGFYLWTDASSKG